MQPLHGADPIESARDEIESARDESATKSG
jgi:hypothetical protein